MGEVHRGVLYSGAGAFGAALFYIPYKAAASAAPLDHVVLAMLFAAAVFNTTASLVLTRGRLRIDRLAVIASVTLAVLTVVGNVAVAESLVRIDTAITSVVLQTQIFFVAAGGHLALGERITPRLVAGSVAALVGIALIQAPWNAGAADLAGTVAAVFGALSFATMLVVTRRVIRRIDPVAVNALRLWLAVGFLALLPGNASGALRLDGEIWLLAAAAAAVGPTASRLLLMAGLRFIPAAHVNLVGLLTPAFTLALAFALLGESLAPRELLGGLVILLGVALPILEVVRGAPGPRSAG